MTSFADALAAHRDDDCCMFTTTGRKTGNPHRIEIWFGAGEGGDTAYLISGNGPGAHWFMNALANPTCTIELGDVAHVVTASEVTDPDERRRIGELMGEKYPWDGDPSIGLTRQKWCFEVPLLALREAH